MDAFVFLNGKYLSSASDAMVSLFDRGYLLGDSFFETLRAYGGVVFRLDEHLERFAHAADILGMAAPEGLRDIVQTCVTRSALQDAYVRITMSRGEGPPGLAIEGCGAPVLSVIVRALHRYPSEGYRSGIRSTVLRTPRVPAACLDPSIKTGNLLSTIQARRELSRLNMEEGVQLSVEGRVVCGTISNVFVSTRGVLRTPDLGSGCRAGVTRGVVLALAHEVGLLAREEPLRVEELLVADEVFFTNTIMECLPVSAIDGMTLPGAPGPAFRAIRGAFDALVARESELPMGPRPIR